MEGGEGGKEKDSNEDRLWRKIIGICQRAIGTARCRLGLTGRRRQTREKNGRRNELRRRTFKKIRGKKLSKDTSFKRANGRAEGEKDGKARHKKRTFSCRTDN